MKTFHLIHIFFISTISYSQLEVPPPLQEILESDEMRDSLIMEIVDLTRYYEIYTYSKDSIVNYFSVQNNWSEEKKIDIFKSLSYQRESDWMYLSIYSTKTIEELQVLKDYFITLSDKEIIAYKLKHQENIVYNIIGTITWNCNRANNN